MKKIVWILFMVLFMSMSVNADTYGMSGIDVEEEVEQIRSWYYSPTTLDQKYLLDKGTDGWDYYREYYFHDGELCFVFVYNETEEHRLYFKTNVGMIRYIDPYGNIHNYGNTDAFWDLECRVFSESRQFVGGKCEPVTGDVYNPFSYVDVEAEVEQIQSWYYNPTALDKKYVLDKGTDGWNYYREYYVHDGRLYFVFVYDGTEEHRMYFKNDIMIRYIDPNKNTYDCENTAAFWDLENRVYAESRQFVKSVSVPIPNYEYEPFEYVDVEAEVEQIRSWYYNPTALDEKYVLDKGTDGWNYYREYHFHDGKLFFVFIYDGTEEYRLYFKEDVMIRYIESDGMVYDYGNTESFWKLENRVLVESRQF